MIAIVAYGMGNTASIRNMLRRIGEESVITSDPNVIQAADALILPGVGAFDHGMQSIHAMGLANVLHDAARHQHKPILGICLGMQLMTRGSEEGSCPGLGWIDADTIRFRLSHRPELKVPHMGWNTTTVHRPGALFPNLDAARFYFVHSYHVVCDQDSDVLATAHHGLDVTAAFQHGAIMGTQFHPEKSHRFGMQLLQNFASHVSASALPLAA
ncbi:MAG: imidazole glycerol phosphate synthase subunit HisH [Rhodothermales bacterium]